MKARLLYFIIVIAIAAVCAGMARAFDVLPAKAPAPADNPTTPAKVELGKKLYFDPRLSKTGSVSCASCHNVMSGGEDGRATSFGINGQLGGRNAPTVFNAAFQSVQFWDGRAASLEEQAKGPLVNPIEMGMESHAAVVARLKEIPGYLTEFKTAFGGSGSINADPVNIDNFAKAVAAYERTLITPNSPHDRFVKGDKKALTAEAQSGMKKFQSIGCTTCHTGPNFSGPAMPAGQGFFMKFPTVPGSGYEEKYDLLSDQGRYEVTKNEADRHMYRVPSLRNVALTAPYFHNGRVATLEEAVRVMARVQIGKTLTDDDVRELVAFLKSLTGKLPKQTMPRLPDTAGRTLIR